MWAVPQKCKANIPGLNQPNWSQFIQSSTKTKQTQTHYWGAETDKDASYLCVGRHLTFTFRSNFVFFSSSKRISKLIRNFYAPLKSGKAAVAGPRARQQQADSLNSPTHPSHSAPAVPQCGRQSGPGPEPPAGHTHAASMGPRALELWLLFPSPPPTHTHAHSHTRFQPTYSIPNDFLSTSLVMSCA